MLFLFNCTYLQKLFFAYLFFSFIHFTLLCQNPTQEKENTSEVESFECEYDLKQAWVEFDEENMIYIPYVKLLPPDIFSVYFTLSTITKNKYLKIQSTEQLSVFVNSKLIYLVKPHEEYILPLSTLFFSKSNEIVINLYSSHLDKIEPSTCIGNFGTIEGNNLLNDNDFPQTKRNIGNYKVFGIFAFLTVSLMLLIYTRLYRSISDYYFNVREMLVNQRNTNTLLYSRLNDSSHHFLLFILSMLIAYLYIIVEKKDALDSIVVADNMRTVDIPIWVFIYQWLSYSFYVYFLIIIKLISINVVSNVLGAGNTFRFYSFEFFRLGLFVFLIAFTISIYFFLKDYEPVTRNYNFIYIIIFGLAFIRILILSYKLYFAMDKNKLFTFSYVCIIDLIPYLICLKIFLFDD